MKCSLYLSSFLLQEECRLGTVTTATIHQMAHWDICVIIHLHIFFLLLYKRILFLVSGICISTQVHINIKQIRFKIKINKFFRQITRWLTQKCSWCFVGHSNTKMFSLRYQNENEDSRNAAFIFWRKNPRLMLTDKTRLLGRWKAAWPIIKHLSALYLIAGHSLLRKNKFLQSSASLRIYGCN